MTGASMRADGAGNASAGGDTALAQEVLERRGPKDVEKTAVDDGRLMAAGYSSMSRGEEQTHAGARDASTTGKPAATAAAECFVEHQHGEKSYATDEYAVQFSAAQVKTQVAQARLEAKMAADEELLAARKELVERQYEVQDRERERDEALARCEAMQQRVDALLEEHKHSWQGMRKEEEHVKLQTLVATLDVEKSTREKLSDAFEVQQRALAHAQERVEALDAQIANYQKTETVLAQSVSHLQHRFDSKDQQRAATVERIKRDLTEQQEQETAALREELAVARRTEQMAQDQLTELQKEHAALCHSAKQVLESQKGEATREQELLATIERLEKEKAVLQSKAEQIQKTDAQLRSRVHTQSEELAVLRAQKETLQRDNKELGAIASDLMEMAEKQHAEKAQLQLGGIEATSPAVAASASNATAHTPQSASSSTHEEDEAFLQQRRKRLRLSLG